MPVVSVRWYSWLFVLVGVTLAAGCARATHGGGEKQTVHPRPAASSLPPQRLVIAIVLDQLGSATLARHLPHLDADGALRTMVREGAFFPRANYPHAVTLTAPGHALLFTGATPAASGIVSNRFRHEGQQVTSVQDGEHTVLGSSERFAGAGLLRAQTVAEALRAEHAQAKVVSISLKDRGAILPVGAVGDAVLWYAPETLGFTTSTQYGTSLPAFVETFATEHPAADMLMPWTVPDASALLERLGPDAAPGEGDMHGFGIVFPHDPRAGGRAGDVLPVMPVLSERLVALAKTAVAAEGLGQDEVPDLLVLSISGTDYAGHVFGPDSWEYFDHLRRVDRALGAWLRELSKQQQVAVLLTSDHGVARLAEQQQGSRRLPTERLSQGVETLLDQQVGPRDWVDGFSAPYLYLANGVASDADVRGRVCEALRADSDVAWAVDPVAESGPCALSALPPGLQRPVGRSLYSGRGGDFYIVPEEGVVLDEGRGTGTTHGTPWHYDRMVPVVVWAEGVSPGCREAVVGTEQVAPTLSRLLGVAAPAQAEGKPLPIMMAPPEELPTAFCAPARSAPASSGSTTTVQGEAGTAQAQ